MLRFDKLTVGRSWVGEYGDPASEDIFPIVHSYSPVHNVKSGTEYPATLIATADDDNRVAPAHSYKFGAALQAAQAGRAPILLRIDSQVGHGDGKPMNKLIDEQVDILSFFAKTLAVRNTRDL